MSPIYVFLNLISYSTITILNMMVFDIASTERNEGVSRVQSPTPRGVADAKTASYSIIVRRRFLHSYNAQTAIEPERHV